MTSDPEELLRSIERTREELAHTVDTIVARLDPKRAALRGVGAVRTNVSGIVESARQRLSLPGADGTLERSPSAESGSAAAGLAKRARALPTAARQLPKPLLGAGLAALVALAAVLAVRRRQR